MVGCYWGGGVMSKDNGHFIFQFKEKEKEWNALLLLCVVDVDVVCGAMG